MPYDPAPQPKTLASAPDSDQRAPPPKAEQHSERPALSASIQYPRAELDGQSGLPAALAFAFTASASIVSALAGLAAGCAMIALTLVVYVFPVFSGYAAGLFLAGAILGASIAALQRHAVKLRAPKLV